MHQAEIRERKDLEETIRKLQVEKFDRYRELRQAVEDGDKEKEEL